MAEDIFEGLMQEAPVEEKLRVPPMVYGGPYNQESSAITLESTKETPDYDTLVSSWKTISQGAVAFINDLKNPKPIKDGPFVNNAVFVYEKSDADLDIL